MDFLRNIDAKYRKRTWDLVVEYRKDHKRFPSMVEMVKMVGQVQDMDRRVQATDLSRPWGTLAAYHTDTDDSDNDQDSDSSVDVERAGRKRKSNRRVLRKDKRA